MNHTPGYNKQAVGIPENGYFYDNQFRNYILQFMAVFTGLQVQVGSRKTGNIQQTTDCDGNIIDTQPVFEDKRLISVPIHYGPQDRVVASILAENTQNKLLRLPTLSAYARGLSLKTEYFAGLQTERRNAYLPTGGLIPDDIAVVHQRKPMVYDLEMELAIYASNTDQYFQILEQILPLFDPQLQIQTNDSIFDWTKITHIELISIAFDQNYPSGTDRRIIQGTLLFKMPVWISIPADVRKDFIQKIFVRVGAVSTSAQSNYDIIAELDAQGIDYELWFSSDDLSIK